MFATIGIHLALLTWWVFLGAISQRGPGFWEGGMVLVFLTMMIAPWITVLFSGVSSIRQFIDAFALRAPRREHLAAAVALGFAIQVIAIELYGGGLGGLQLRRQWDVFCVAAMLAPFLEEPVFRGYLYPAFRTRYSILGATAVVTFFWLATHVTQIRENPFHVAPFALGSVAMCMFRERTGNLWPAIAFHLGYNVIPAASL